MPVHFPLKLVSSRMLAPTVRHFAFVRDDGQALDFLPGQFVQVHFHYDDGKPTKRSYSIATQAERGQGPGDPVEIMAAASGELDLLVCGSRGHGALGEVVLRKPVTTVAVTEPFAGSLALA